VCGVCTGVHRQDTIMANSKHLTEITKTQYHMGQVYFQKPNIPRICQHKQQTDYTHVDPEMIGSTKKE